MPIKTQSALINPYKLPRDKDLSAAERRFVRCMKVGRPCQIGAPYNIDYKVSRPEKEVADGKHANTVRASIIGFFVSGGSKKHPIRGNIIRLQGAWVPDVLDLGHTFSPYTLALQNCHFAAPIGVAHSEFPFLQLDGSLLAGGLQGDGMRITGHLFMEKGFSAESDVCLADANIGGCLFCGGGKFKKKKYQDARAAISADRITVGGNMSLDNGFFAEGEVRIPAAKIGSDLYCDKGSFNGGIFAKSAKIKNRLSLYGVRGHGAIDLSFASADVLADDEQSRQRFYFNLDEFSYARFAKPASIQSRINWLAQRPAGVKFSPQPFEQAAKVLFAMGRNNDAREILLAKEKYLTQEMRISKYKYFRKLRVFVARDFRQRKKIRRVRAFIGRLWAPVETILGRFAKLLQQIWGFLASHVLGKMFRRFWNFAANYGYRVRNTLLCSVLVILAGSWVFESADKSHHIVPHQPVVLAHEDYKNYETTCKCGPNLRPTEVVECVFPEYPSFHALAYSVDVFIPFFALHQEPYWYPHPREGAPVQWRFVLWYWFEIFAGWVLTSLFVLSVTGLLRPRHSSD